MTTRALVTGGTGFVAQWAMRAMLQRGWVPVAAGIGPSPETAVLSAEECDRIEWRVCDVTSQSDVRRVVEESLADVVVHLAAISHVPAAMTDPAYAFEVNAVGTVRLLAEIRRVRDAGGTDPVVLVVGSAEQYGRHDASEMPLGESAEQRPLTQYAASKMAQEAAALQAFRSEGLRVICTRSFNHSGVGHGAQFLLPGLVARALELPSSGGLLPIGNAETVRDFLHVSDVALAYLSLLERGVGGEVYNVCSGEGASVRALAESVLRRLDKHASVTVDPARVRAVDVPVLVGNNNKLQRATGWKPQRPREDIIDDLIHAATQ